MALAKLTLTIPSGIWIGELSREFPGATVRVLAAFTDDGTGVGLAEIDAPDLQPVLARMTEFETVPVIDVLQAGDRQALVQFETTMPLLLQPALDSGVPLEMPFEIRDGDAVWEVTAPRERLSALGEQLAEYGITYRVDYVRDRIADEQLLTDRQRDLLVAAVDAGYYDTPRECSLTALAEQRDIAKSTASETLHRAEEKVTKEYVASLPGTGEGETAEGGPDGGLAARRGRGKPE